MISKNYHRMVMQYDNRRQRIKAETYDKHGKLVTNTDGYASFTEKYDARGNMTETTCYDENRNLTEAKYGYARMTTSYDSRGNNTGVAYFGADGKLKVLEGRVCARVSYRYDANGNQIEECCYGANDTLEWRVAKKFNTLRQKIEARYFDHNGKPKKIAGKFQHVTKSSHDSRGNKIEEIYLGIDGERVQGVSSDANKICDRWTAKYDATGKQVETKCHVDR